MLTLVVIPAIYAVVKGDDPVAALGSVLTANLTAEVVMMNDMMGTGMMWGMGLVWLLIVILLVLGIAALVKYVFFK